MLRIISGEFGSRKIKSLETDETRPTTDKVKAALFSKIGPYFADETLLDPFAGSGAIGFEALSRGCSQVTLADKNPKAIDIIKENAKTLNVVDRTEVILGSYKQSLLKTDKSYDYIYLDPPYALECIEECIYIINEKNLLKENGYLIVENPKEKTFLDNYDNLVKVKEAVYGISKLTYYKKGE